MFNGTEGTKAMTGLPGYDNWKLMTPEEDYEARGGEICPFCGAYSPRSCDMDGFEETGICPWDESHPDPDAIRDMKQDR